MASRIYSYISVFNRTLLSPKLALQYSSNIDPHFLPSPLLPSFL